MAESMIRVLRIINRFNLGGPTYNAAYLTRYLPEPFQTKLIGGSHMPEEESSLFICNNLGIEAEVIPEMSRSINPLSDVKAYRKIKEIIREFKPHIVHTHAAKAGALGRRAARAMGVPVVVHTFHGHVFHSYFGKTRTAFYKNLERRLARRSDAIIAISHLQKKELVDFYRIAEESKVAVIPLGFDLSRFNDADGRLRQTFRDQYKIKTDDLVVAIVGRLVPVKNHTFFIQSMTALLHKYGDRLKVVITGDGEEREKIIRLIEETGYSHAYWPMAQKEAQFILTSWIHDAERVYAAADVVCLTSLNEGTPVSLIEAQAMGLPVVSTITGGIEEVVVNHETGILTEQGNEDAFVQALDELLSQPAKRLSMGKAGQKHVFSRYGYQTLVQGVTGLYHKLLISKGIEL